ncbi:uncharacterized protein LOC106706722 isoform X3 [Latimeria chalumnae]|uniref:uncharacterized protein LOC106706722 isoform X3 n=1 Tax=Latimeria chalumnae TaxID=7897 RepID=UPI00313ECD06
MERHYLLRIPEKLRSFWFKVKAQQRAGLNQTFNLDNGLFDSTAYTLSVIGTWYVTVVIIKYLWPDPEISAGDIPSSRSPPGGAVLHRRESASKSAQRSLSMQCCDQQENI